MDYSKIINWKLVEIIIQVMLVYLLILLAFVKIPETNRIAKECQVKTLCKYGALQGWLCEKFNVTEIQIGDYNWTTPSGTTTIT